MDRSLSILRDISQTWTLERDVFSNIQRWGDIDLDIGVWDTIESHSQGEEIWKWERDSTGRLTGIEVNEERIEIAYDGSGEPVRWTQGDDVSTIKRNHWGWVTNIDEQWLQHDPRGLVEKSGIYDLTWRWNRNASGFPVVKDRPIAQDLSLPATGFIDWFPNGEMQTYRLQSSGIVQSYTNIQAQEVADNKPRRMGVDGVLGNVLSNEQSSHNVGIHH